jgi:NADH-quinone oxidoreductase subunit N
MDRAAGEAVVSVFLLLPELIMAVLAVGLICLDLLVSDKARHWLGYVAVIGQLIAAGTAVMVGRERATSFFGTFALDPLATLVQVVLLLTAALVTLSAIDYMRRRTRYQGEFYALIVFATLGAMFLVSANELITLYVALELTSICQIILAGFLKDDARSAEAGLKYLLVGALSSAVLLYGLAIVYGATGVTGLVDIGRALASGSAPRIAFVGIALLVAGFGFKMVVVPFQMYVPDVYEGAPTPVVAYLSVASKIAAFAAVLRVFGTALLPLQQFWPALFAILAALTMTAGNIAALRQTNIKRLMGYSSIGQAGYALCGLAAASQSTTAGMLFFLVAYALTNLGVFIAIVHFSSVLGTDDLSGYAGLARRSPLVAAGLTIGLLSLVGLPLTVGFWSKVYLFLSVYNVGLAWLVVVGLLNSALAAYYYLKIVHAMYLRPPTSTVRAGVDPALAAALAVSIAAVIVTGIIPGPLIQVTGLAAGVLFPM